MSRHTVLQHRLVHRGREFHFVSYEGHPANPTRGEEAMPPTWFLMSSGKRWNVMPPLHDQPVTDRHPKLALCLKKNVFLLKKNARSDARHRTGS